MPFFRRKPQGVPADLTGGDPRAARLLEAVDADDLDGVRGVLTAATGPEEREALTSLLTERPGHADLFDAWVQREPDEPAAWLARGVHGTGWAWDARGGAYAEHVTDEGWETFFDRLRDAEADLLRAAELAPRDAVPWSHMLTSGRGLQVPKEELWMRYEEAQSRHPWLPEAHQQMLQAVCEKWYGSDAEALEFARRVDREAPEGAPARAVVPMAHVEVWLDMRRREGAEPDAYIRSDEVQEEIRAAAGRSVLASGFPDDLVGVHPLNIFAVAFYLGFDDESARAIVERLGRRRSEFPWYYVDEPDAAYAKLLGE